MTGRGRLAAAVLAGAVLGGCGPAGAPAGSGADGGGGSAVATAAPTATATPSPSPTPEDTVTVAPTPSDPHESPRPPGPSPVEDLPIDPGPPVTRLRGTVSEGVEAGCVLLDAGGTSYLLLGEGVAELVPGTEVVAVGRVAKDVMSYCQQGTPFQVRALHPVTR